MKEALRQLIGGATLTREQTHDIMLGITQEKYPTEQIAAMLMAFQMRGVTVDELLGLRDGLVETGKHITFDQDNTLDIVGTGGDGKNTFNISTCSSFVVAGAGFHVTKHGNAASTSVSGASNVLQALGAKFTDNRDILQRSLDEAGICYLHAPLFALGMRFVGPTRRAIAVPTCFNLLGPLVNPCSPKNSFHGTATKFQQGLYTTIHERLGDNYGVVFTTDGYDEVSLTSPFIVNMKGGKVETYSPADLGMATVAQKDICGGANVEEAKAILLDVLHGKATEAQTNVVLASAACAIHVMRTDLGLTDCLQMADESLKSGRALKALRTFIDVNS